MRSHSAIRANRRPSKRRRFVVQLEAGITPEAAAAVCQAALADDLGRWVTERWGLWDPSTKDWVRRKLNAKSRPRVWVLETEAAANQIASVRYTPRGQRLQVKRIS